MPYSRRIVHYSPGPTDFVSVISNQAVAGCWFELHRQGGNGPGTLVLNNEFPLRQQIDIGDWIAFDYEEGDRWYFGRVESRTSKSPAGVTFRLEGMGVELGEVFPGGFSRTVADQVPPHLYAQTDLFPNDPDYSDETVDAVSEAHELVQLLLQQYVVPKTHITLDLDQIEPSFPSAEVTSAKFRGEESARSIIKDLALRARNASWGVDSNGTFFFLRKRTDTIATFREGVDLLSLEESRDREMLYNRVVLTGDYVYDETVNSEVTARGLFRWRGNYIQPASRSQYGERRIRLWVPWIRTRSDSRAFTQEFFRTYAQPAARYLVEVAQQTTLPKPWDGAIRLEDRDGNELITAPIETIRVQFDQTPRFRLEIGPEDPHTHWPEPPQDERWEIPGDQSPDHGGDIITFSQSSSSSSSSAFSSELSSNEESSSIAPASSDPPGSSDPLSDPPSDLSSDPNSFLSDLSSDSSSFSSSSSSESSLASSSSGDLSSSAPATSESGILVDCCGSKPLPNTLYATIVDDDLPIHRCDCADGKEIPLDWDGSRWVGSDSFGSCNTTSEIHLELECVDAPGQCLAFRLHVSFTDGCSSNETLSPSSCECNPVPLNIVFDHFVDANCCDSVTGPVPIQIVITE